MLSCFEDYYGDIGSDKNEDYKEYKEGKDYKDSEDSTEPNGSVEYDEDKEY